MNIWPYEDVSEPGTPMKFEDKISICLYIIVGVMAAINILSIWSYKF